MKCGFWLALLALAVAPMGFASSCGTIASPNSCSITVGTNTYTVSNFLLQNSNGGGGGAAYQAGDVNIDISSGGGLTLLMSFSKNAQGPTAGLVFLANPGNTSNFTVTYDVLLSTVAAGTVAFTTPDTVSFATSSAVGTGFSSDQMILEFNSNGTSCQAIRNSGGLTQGNCNTLPPGTTTSLRVNNLVGLSGNTGNTSIGTFTNLLDSTFTPTTAPSVPEPSTYALVGLGIFAAGVRRRMVR